MDNTKKAKMTKNPFIIEIDVSKKFRRGNDDNDDSSLFSEFGNIGRIYYALSIETTSAAEWAGVGVTLRVGKKSFTYKEAHLSREALSFGQGTIEKVVATANKAFRVGFNVEIKVVGNCDFYF